MSVCCVALPAPGAASGGGGLAGRAQPLTRRYAIDHGAEAEQVESFITFITQNELIVLSCRKTDELHIKSVGSVNFLQCVAHVTWRQVLLNPSGCDFSESHSVKPKE